MIGTLLSVLRGRCTCGTCVLMHGMADRTLLRRFREGRPPSWDHDLCADDLERLARAGFPEQDVRSTVELLAPLLVALLSEPPSQHPSEPSEDERKRARQSGRANCMQDQWENVPFASVGGLDARDAMKAPRWIAPAFRQDYLEGYREAASDIYGDEWKTEIFSWKPAATIIP